MKVVFGGAMVPTHRHHLPSNDSAPRRARTWVAGVLHEIATEDGRWRPDVVRDAVLCTSELVTTSLIANTSTMDVLVVIESDFFRLSVLDDARVASDRYDSGYRAQLIGFRLIDALADEWGINPNAEGRELWAEFRSRAAQATA